MSDYRPREAEFNFATVMDFLLRNKFPILGITVLAGLLGAIFSGPTFIPPKYKSTAIFYPSTTNSISKGFMPTEGYSKDDPLAFGEEEEAEQMLQLLQSDDITNQIIKRFDLMKHYRIDPSDDYPYTKLVKEFSENVKYRRTEYMSIEISVLDEDPKLAAQIANHIMALVDSTKHKVQNVRAKEGLRIVEAKYLEKQAYLKELADSLGRIGDLGVPPYSTDASGSEGEYYRAMASGNTAVVNELKRIRALQAKYAPIQKSLMDRIEFDSKELSLLRSKLEQARVDAEEFMPAINVINVATAAERKHYPVRSLIMLVSAGSAFALSILVLAFLNQYKQYRRDKKFREIVENTALADA